MSATLELYPADERLQGGARTVFTLHLVSALALFVLLMLLGLTMRMAQAQWIGVPADWFYRLLSMHGAGMVGSAALGSMAVMWYFLRKYVPLHLWAFACNYVLFIVGALAIVASVFLGGYGALWTFLYPLPAQGMGLWSNGAAALFMLGLMLIGLGALVFYLDATAAIVRVYGNLGRALGLQWLLRGRIDPEHPKAVVASVMVIIANTLGIIAGEVALTMSLINLYYPEITLNALLAKNLIYWFGHMYANATIYMAVIAIYELLPRYTGRPYLPSRPFLWAWVVSCAYVIVVFPHHLLMDFAQPRWVSTLGQLASWVGGFPVFLVTGYGALTNLYRSGLRWSMPVRLMVLSLFGWAAGVIPAIFDGTIRVNLVMHNTQWVPGHFHFYMLLGMLSMILALAYHVLGRAHGQPCDTRVDRSGLALYVVGGLIFVGGFLLGGHASVPRRMAEHLSSWTLSDAIGATGGSLVLLAMLYFCLRASAILVRAAPERGAP